MAQPDGGPAFPQHEAHTFRGLVSGLSVRDYFAAAALPSIVTAVYAGRIYVSEETAETEVIASAAYEVADAMIGARSAGRSSSKR